MNAAVVLRRKKTNENAESKKENSMSGSTYFSRPKSWSEFQSNMKVFQGIQAPRKFTTETSNDKPVLQQIIESDAMTTENAVAETEATETKAAGTKADGTATVTFRKKPSEILPSSKFVGENKKRKRPLSEVLLPTPFYKPFRVVNLQQHQSISSASNSSDQTNHDKGVNETQSVITENSDIPSLMFEEALDSDDIEIATLSTSLPKVKQADTLQKSASKEHAMEKLYYVRPFRKEKQAAATNPSTKLEVNTGPFQVLHKETHFKPVQITENLKSEKVTLPDKPPNNEEINDVKSGDLKNPKSVISKVEICSNENTDFDSESSSVVDTGFYSFGEKTESIVTVDAEIDFDLDVEETNNVPFDTKSSVSPKETHSTIPTPLQSCYRKSIEMNSNYDSSSRSSSASIEKSSVLSSGNAFEEESASEVLSIENTCDSTINSSIGCEGDRSTEDSKEWIENETKQLLPVLGQQFNKSDANEDKLPIEVDVKHSDINSIDTAIDTGSPLRPLVHFEQSPQQNHDPIPKKRTLAWKDDQHAPVGALDRVSSLNGENQDQAFYHGTWPRRAQKSQKRKDREEAEELMCRFRETAETYRARFRNIYAETRRKIDEAMFGLRVAMAKNGYSAKLHQPNNTKCIM